MTEDREHKVVTEGTHARLDEVNDHSDVPLSARLMAIGRDCVARLKEPYRTIEHGELLYGDDGLPR